MCSRAYFSRAKKSFMVNKQLMVYSIQDLRPFLSCLKKMNPLFWLQSTLKSYIWHICISSCIDIAATESTNITTTRKWTVVYDLSLTLVNISYYISHYWSHVPSHAYKQRPWWILMNTVITNIVCILDMQHWKIYICLYIFKDKLHYHLVFKSNQLRST